MQTTDWNFDFESLPHWDTNNVNTTYRIIEVDK